MSEPEKQSEETPTPKYVPKPEGADPFATRLVAELPHDRGILGCRYTADGKFLFAGARDYFVHRWDMSIPPVVEEPEDPKKKPKTPPLPTAPPEAHLQMAGHGSWVAGVAPFADGNRLVSGDFVGGLSLWSDVTGNPVQQFHFQAHTGSIRKVAVSPDGTLVASAGNDGAVRVWHTDAAEKLKHELLGHECHVYHVAFHPNGESLISADLKGRVKHWDVKTGKQVRELDASLLYTYSEKYEVEVGGIRGMNFSTDGSLLCCAGATGDKGIAHSGSARVVLLDWESGNVVRELKPDNEDICTAWGVHVHPDGFIVASGGSRTGGYLWFWTPEEEVAFHMLKFQQRAPGFDLDLAPDNKTLAVANHDGTIRLYEMAAEVKAETPTTQS